MTRLQNKKLKEMKAALQKKMSAFSPVSFPESTDRSRSRALKQRFSQSSVEEVSSIPTHSFQSFEIRAPSQSSEHVSAPAREDKQLRVKQLEDSRMAVLRQEVLSEEALFKQEVDLVREMMALYQECVTATEEERKKRSEERKRYVATVVKEAEKKKEEVAPKPLSGSLGLKNEAGEVSNGKKEVSTPTPSFGKGPSFGAKTDSAFGAKTNTGNMFGTKTDSTNPLFAPKTDTTKPSVPSFGGSFGFKSESGGLFGAKTSEVPPKPPAPSFGGGTGMFGAKKEEPTFKPSFGNGSMFGGTENAGGMFGDAKGGESVPSFGGNSSFGAKKDADGLFGAKASGVTSNSAPSFNSSSPFGSTNGGLFGSKKDDSSKPFSFGPFGKGEAPKPPSFSSGLFGKKDTPK